MLVKGRQLPRRSVPAPCDWFITHPRPPQDGYYQFNTQVAFSEDGGILGKYHKLHLVPPLSPCFDGFPPRIPDNRLVSITNLSLILRQNLNLLCLQLHLEFDLAWWYASTFSSIRHNSSTWLKVASMTLSTRLGGLTLHLYWQQHKYATIDTRPFTSFLTLPKQMQHGWSFAFERNLLGTAGGTGWATTGFGIFSNGTILASQYNTSRLWSSSMLMADVPILPNSKISNPTHAKFDPSPSLKTRILNLTAGSPLSASLDNGDVFCQLDLLVRYQNHLMFWEFPELTFGGGCFLFYLVPISHWLMKLLSSLASRDTSCHYFQLLDVDWFIAKPITRQSAFH